MAAVKIKTPNISGSIQTVLTADYTSGTNLQVASSVGFVNNARIIIGEPYLENTELINLSATPPDNTDLTIASLKFSHPAGTPVYYVDWDKYELSYRVSSTDSWVAYGSMPDSLVFDALYKEYRDSSATSTYQWRYRYYSSEKSAYSDYSDIIGTTGWSRNTAGYMIQEIRKIVNDLDGSTVTDTEILHFLNACQDKVFTLYDRWWFLLKYGTAISTVAGIKTYGLPTDFGRMKNLSFRYVSGASDITYNLRYVSMDEFDYQTRDNNAADDDNLKIYSIYPPDSSNTAGYIRVWPKPLTAGLSITPFYYQAMSDLTSYGSTTLIPLPDMLENYAIAQILKIRKEDDKAGTYDGLFKEQTGLLKLMQRKNVNSMRSLWKYKGVDPAKRWYGTRSVYSGQEKELYW